MKHGDGNMTDLGYRVIPDLYAGIEPNVGAANIRLGLNFDYFIRKIDYINVKKNRSAPPGCLLHLRSWSIFS